MQSPDADDWLLIEFSVSSSPVAWGEYVNPDEHRHIKLAERRVQPLDAAAFGASFPTLQVECNPPHRITGADGPKEWIDFRIIMQIGGRVVPICDTFAVPGECEFQFFDNVEGIVLRADVQPSEAVFSDVDPMVHWIDVGPQIPFEPTYVDGTPTPNPVEMYGTGAAGFQRLYGDLRSAMRGCSRDPEENYIGRDGRDAHFADDPDPVRRWMMGGS